MTATAASEDGANPLPTASQRLAVVATGEDQRLILEMLSQVGGEAAPSSLGDVAEGILQDSLAAAIITEEAIGGAARSAIEDAVERQPPWSDFPFIFICDRSALEDLSDLLARLGKITIVERPIHPVVLENAAKSALRARSRQREAVGFLLQRQDAEEHLRQLTTTLEKRVRERMRDLRAANQRLVQEVRERHAAEERLRESEELYRYTVELSQQMVWTATPDGVMVSVNRRFHEITGIPEDLAPHDAWLRAVHPDDIPQLMAHWQGALASGDPHHGRFRMRIADGSYRTFVARAAPRHDEEGRIVRWYGFTEDVTEQIRSETARLGAEERYRLAAKATNSAIWDLDLTAHDIRWTASETAFFGYQVVGEQTTLAWWEERVHPQDRSRVLKSLNKAIAGRHSHWSDTYRFLRANGEYADIFDQGFIIRDDHGVAMRAVGAMSDLSDQARAAAEIQRIQAELIHVSRVSAMGTMASTLAHELNQPLVAVSSYIRGSLRLLESMDDASLGRVREALDAAEGAALRAGHIVKRLRELVARGNVSPRVERLSKVIEDANSIAFLDEHLLGVSHRVDLDPAAELVEVDAIQIQQVLINLVRNAVQAMEGQPRREIVIATSAISPGTVEVSVSDTGAGIPAGVRAALFSPFQSSKPEGIGIGLSISRTIIEAHGGHIWADDGAEGGTVFRFTLPRAQPPEEVAV